MTGGRLIPSTAWNFRSTRVAALVCPGYLPHQQLFPRPRIYLAPHYPRICTAAHSATLRHALIRTTRVALSSLFIRAGVMSLAGLGCGCIGGGVSLPSFGGGAYLLPTCLSLIDAHITRVALRPLMLVYALARTHQHPCHRHSRPCCSRQVRPGWLLLIVHLRRRHGCVRLARQRRLRGTARLSGAETHAVEGGFWQKNTIATLRPAPCASFHDHRCGAARGR